MHNCNTIVQLYLLDFANLELECVACNTMWSWVARDSIPQVEQYFQAILFHAIQVQDLVAKQHLTSSMQYACMYVRICKYSYKCGVQPMQSNIESSTVQYSHARLM